MKKTEIRLIILVIYLQIVLIIYFISLYPALEKPKNLPPTQIPLLSTANLKEAQNLLSNKGKVWISYPQEPDISSYTFGQSDPIK